MNIRPDFEISASQKSKWHAGPNGCKYRFEFARTMKVEWEGTRPPFRAKGFWMRYARRRDAFLVDVIPAGMTFVSACCFTGTVRILTGKGAAK